MSGNRILILADDLTGANDTAIQFVNRELSALVITRSVPADTGFFDGYDVVAVNSDSRGMSAGEAYRAVRAIAEQFGSGYFVYKKVDSVLRGNPGRELAAVMDALGVPFALAAPSFPANRSVIEKGMLYSGGKTAADGETARADAVRIFAEGTGRKTENIPLEKIRQGAAAVTEFIKARNAGGTQVFVADALTDNDLETVYGVSSALDTPHILAGSAGLANQLACSRVTRHCAPPRQGNGGDGFTEKAAALSPVLVIAGTRQAETAAQVTTLSARLAIPVVKFNVRLIAAGQTGEAVVKAYDEAARLMKQGVSPCVVAVDSMFQSVDADNGTPGYTEGDDTGAAISDALGSLVEKLAAAFKFPVILSTGGDTSLGICRRIGINAIEPLAEICPGIPLGRITGGAYDGRFIITKSGRFGNPDSLVDIMNYLCDKEKAV